MSENTVPIKKNMLNMSLFSIIFIIFYYLINKINKKYDCFADVSNNSDINAAIVNAVNNKYKADVEAIRNLSSIAYALHKENNLIVPADLTILGTIKSNKIDLGYNHVGREQNSGKIEYGTFESDVLGIVGKGTNGTDRKVKLWDDVAICRHLNVGGAQTIGSNLNVGANLNVGNDLVVATNTTLHGTTVNGGLTVNGPSKVNSLSVGGDTIGGSQVTFNGSTLLKGGYKKDNTQASYSHLPWTDGYNYISGNTIFRQGHVNFQDGLNVSDRIDLGYTDSQREPNAGTIGYGTHDLNALCIVGKGTSNTNRKVRLWDDVTVDKNLNVGANLNVGNDLVVATNTTLGGTTVNGQFTVNGPSKVNSLSVGGDAIGGSQVTFNGSTLFKGGNKPDNSQAPYTHLPWTDGNNYISGNTIFREGNVNFQNGLKIGSWTIKEVDNRLIFSRNNQGLIMVSDGGCNRLRPLNGDCGSDGNGNHHFRIEW